MKKAKIMLMAIAVLAVVGGALAFKAVKFNQLPYGTCAGTSTTDLCSSNEHFLFSTTTDNPNVKITTIAPIGQHCVETVGGRVTCTSRLIFFAP